MSGVTPGRGGQRVGIVEGWELRSPRRATNRGGGALKGLVFLIILLVVLVVGGWFLARPVIGPAVTGLFEANHGVIRMPIVADVLAAELADRVDVAAGSGADEIEFVIEEGQSIDAIEQALVEQGLLTDPVAFQYLIASDRVDQLIRAGTYTMTPQHSPSDIVTQLSTGPDPATPLMTLALRPGLRIEQVVAYLQQQADTTQLELDPREFRDLALEPPTTLRDEYTFLKQAPARNSLEGFLAGGVYEVPIDITADEFLHLLLTQWGEENGDLVAQARKRGVDFYRALTIASLVEREVKKDKERARVAGVYWNRLDPAVNGSTAGLMGADPTVVYAADTQALENRGIKSWPDYVFWDTLGVDLNTVQVPARLESFQTYVNPGLPDWPIATPTRKSIQAALKPNTKKKLLFFYSCPGSDTHKFGRNMNQHTKNINSC